LFEGKTKIKRSSHKKMKDDFILIERTILVFFVFCGYIISVKNKDDDGTWRYIYRSFCFLEETKKIIV